ncbi:MAG: D-alanyl-D-alanine carboxypeptidase/D-alanyl-D-alanine-endopeptidase, partial [Gemmataceae bacterium]
MRFCLSAGFLLLVLSPLTRGQDLAPAIEKVLDRPEYTHARWGLHIVDAKTGKTVYAKNADTFCTPASVTKLFSCTTALATFGPDYQFRTPVYRIGNQSATGVVEGGVVLVASGDLTFGGRAGPGGKTLFANSDHTYANGGSFDAELPETNPLAALDDLAKQIHAKGVRQIRGPVWIDDRLFPLARSSGSGPEIVSPMLVNDNVLDVIVKPGAKPGEPAEVRFRPETAYFVKDVDVVTTEEKVGEKGAFITYENQGHHHYSIRGRISVKAKTAVRIIPFESPTEVARALFIEALRRAGIRVDAPLVLEKPVALPSKDLFTDPRKLAEHVSAPLKDAIQVTLKVSHNLYASTLPALVAVKAGGGTIDAGMREQGSILQSLSLDPVTFSFAGGAGGAPADTVTPRATTTLLFHAAQKPYWNALKE